MMPACIKKHACNEAYPEGVILIQAIFEIHHIDKAVRRAADHPVSTG